MKTYKLLFAAGVSWMYNYMGEQPFLEGISTIAKAFNGLGPDQETKLMSGLAAISDQVMEATYEFVVVNPFGTFSTYLEKDARSNNIQYYDFTRTS